MVQQLNTISKNTMAIVMAGGFSVVTGDPLFRHGHGLTTRLRLLGVRSPGAAEMRSDIPDVHCIALGDKLQEKHGNTPYFTGKNNIPSGK